MSLSNHFKCEFSNICVLHDLMFIVPSTGDENISYVCSVLTFEVIYENVTQKCFLYLFCYCSLN